MVIAAKRLAAGILLCCTTFAAASSASSDSSSNVVPVRLLRGYLMIAQVSINDRGPFEFLVDTGSNTTLLDPGLAVELGLHAKDKLQLTSLADATAVPRYFLGKLTVGTLSLSNLEALAAPLPELSAVDGNIRGVLGMNFLLHFSFRLDFDTPALELYSSPEKVRIPGGLTVPVQINQSRLLIPVASSSAAQGTWELVLDSGISQFLVFEDRAAPADEPPCADSSCLMQVSTNLSQQQATIRLLRDLSISDERLPEQQVVILRSGLQPSSDPQDGLMPAAQFHSVFFDRSTATLILSPSPGSLDRAGSARAGVESPGATTLVALQTH